MTETTEILKERGQRYGRFDSHANVTQRLKGVIAGELHIRRKELANDQQEALDMICHKIGRIINGDANYEDSWRDIAGYAQLVADRLLEPGKVTPVCGDTAAESVKDVWDYPISESGKAAINAVREQIKEERLKSSAPEPWVLPHLPKGWRFSQSTLENRHAAIVAYDREDHMHMWCDACWTKL